LPVDVGSVRYAHLANINFTYETIIIHDGSQYTRAQSQIEAGVFGELADIGLSGCSLVVVVCDRKWGQFWGCLVTVLQRPFSATFLATRLPAGLFACLYEPLETGVVA
ncbi:MAG: hypothetical protein ACYS9C_16585, partial [Planctomycetota bacterium]|jgi:hypothetical protein